MSARIKALCIQVAGFADTSSGLQREAGGKELDEGSLTGRDAVAGALPHGSCPCQSAIDKMTEEVEYADQAEDNQQEFTSSCDLSCQRGHDLPPSCSPRSSRGYQWISGINGLQSQVPGIEGQTEAAFTQLQSELDHRGWKITDIILIHLYVSSMEEYGPLNTVYKKHFGTNPPARVCVQAPLPAGRLLQIDCLLHDWTEPLEEGCFHQRDAMHVQSLSHWAPANIGPYSQSVRPNPSMSENMCGLAICLEPDGISHQCVTEAQRIWCRLDSWDALLILPKHRGQPSSLELDTHKNPLIKPGKPSPQWEAGCTPRGKVLPRHADTHIHLVHLCALCDGPWLYDKAGISVYQARTGEGLDLSECIGSQALAYCRCCASAPAPATLPLINGPGPDN
ncbi:unnamed protein product [Pleuronectes platessa]|uniref:Uncharacterized protein n=1 Tax=Pleuronectes platessa TaxID=8262 RepID=A0A9N7UD10_PLEPL|nr:unnamed protein product [Pleuronectes platessa]